MAEPTKAYNRPQPLSDEQVKAILSAEIDDALGHAQGELSEQRRKAISYYKGEPIGNEQEGRSAVVLTDVADTIEWIMPSLVRMFLGGDMVAEYLPNRKEDVQLSKDATEYVNEVFTEESEGFMVLYDLMKTALLEQNGFVKPYYEERTEPILQTFRGLTQERLGILLDDPNVEIMEQDEYETDTGAKLFDVKVRRLKEIGRIRVDGIPPEEFLIARRCVRLNDYTPFSAHRRKLSKSDLIAMGFDRNQVLDLPSDDAIEYDTNRLERHGPDDAYPGQPGVRDDPAAHEVWVTECYIRLDEDGDGFTELRKITVAGETSGLEILEDEEIAWNPCCSVTPTPFPHRFHGVSVADQVMDLQAIRSTILRGILDNMYFLNDSRVVVEEGAVDLDALLTSRPGGIIPAEHVDAVKPLEVKPLGPMPFNVLELLAGVKEERTGVTRYNQGLDASSLNKTATGITSLLNAANARIETIARIFAETGLKDLFKKLLRLVKEAPPQGERTARLRGEFRTVNPDDWDEDMGVRVRVGLGVGQAAERIGHLRMILELQEKAHQMGGSYMVTPENFYNSLRELEMTLGYKAENLFFTNPAGRKPPEPKPDPDLIEAEQKAKKDQADATLKERELEIDRFRVEQDMEIRREELALRREIDMARIEMEERAKERELQVRMKEAAAARQAASQGGSDANAT